MSIEEILTEALTTSLEYAKISERLGTSVRLIRPVCDSLAETGLAHPDIQPELLTAIEKLSETVEAIIRAQKFVEAQTSVTLDKLMEEIDDDEGD